jgi:hypothetical protein
VSRLICFDLTEGRRVNIKETAYKVRTNPLARLTVTLESLADGTLMKISRNELATLLVLEEAELVDDLDEPDAVPSRTSTDISQLPLHRILDWHAKMFVLVRLMPIERASPKGKLFNAMVREAHEQLEAWRTAVGWRGGKTWSPWTLYHDLLRWRKSRYSVSALQKKGVEYSPWGKTPAIYREARRLVKEVGLESPHLSVASTHEAVEARLRTGTTPNE